MAGHFTLIGVQALRDDRLLLWSLAENGLPDDALDIGIPELNGNNKARLEPLQAGRGVQCRLASPDQKKAPVQLRAAMLCDFLNVHRTLYFLADELLNFVHNEE